MATAQNCCDSESPACSPTHSPAAPGRPSARPGQTLSRPPLGGQPQGLAQLELPVTVPSLRADSDCVRDCGPGPGPGPALSDSESVAATAQSNCPTRSRRDWQRLPGPHWQAGRAPPARRRHAAPTRPGGGPPRLAEQCDVCRQNVPQF